MRRVSLHAAAAGLLVALAVCGLAAPSAADDVEVFIQPNIAVIGGCNYRVCLHFDSAHSHGATAQFKMHGACGQLDSISCSGSHQADGCFSLQLLADCCSAYDIPLHAFAGAAGQQLRL